VAKAKCNVVGRLAAPEWKRLLSLYQPPLYLPRPPCPNVLPTLTRWMAQDENLRDTLRDMSRTRMGTWNNTLEARRAQKENEHASKLDEEEKRRQVLTHTLSVRHTLSHTLTHSLPHSLPHTLPRSWTRRRCAARSSSSSSLLSLQVLEVP